MSSRLLIFVLTLVALATGGANLYLSGPDAVRTAHAHLDAQLGRAAKALPAVVSSGTQRNLGLVADIARVPTLQAAIGDTALQKRRPDQQLLDLARETLEARAETRGDVDRNAALLVVATAGGSAEYRLEGGSEFNQEPGVPLVREALEGNTTHALASLGGGFYRLAAVPVGMAEKPLGAVAVGYRVDDRFVEGLRDTLGVDVTLIKGGEIVATSVPAESRGALTEGLVQGGGVFGFEDLPQSFSLFGLLNLPLSLEPIHAARGQTVRVAGIEGAEVVLSTPAITGLIPIAENQKRTVLFSGVVLVLGLLFTVLASGRGSSWDGEEIGSLADDVERMVGGDSSTRATEYLPGDLGRLARGINKLGGRLVAATASGTLGHTPGPAKAPDFSFEGEIEPSTPAENPALDDEPAFTSAGADPAAASAASDDTAGDGDFSDIPAWARQDTNRDAADGFSFGGGGDAAGSLSAFEDSLLGGSREGDSADAADSLAAAASAAAADLDAFSSTAGSQAEPASDSASGEEPEKASGASWGSDPFGDSVTEPAYQNPEPTPGPKAFQPTSAGPQGSLHTGAPLAWELPSAGPGGSAADEPNAFAGTGQGAVAGGSEADFSSLLDATAGPSAKQTPVAENQAAKIDPFVEALREAGRSGDFSGNQEFNPDATMIAAVPEALLRATSRSPMSPERAPAPAAAPAMAAPTWQPPQQPAKAAASTPAFAALQEDEDEAHFRQVFQDFLDTRQSCGEPATNLTYERFAAKLHTNREQLIAKYQCRTVRFTVYVKEGKAALKAAPIRA